MTAEQRFISTYLRLKAEWFEADGDTEASDNFILDLFQEIEDYFNFPVGN